MFKISKLCHRWIIIIAIGLLSALLPIFQKVEVAGADKVLTVLVPAEFPHLDPGETVSGDQYMLKYHIFSRLFTFNEKMEPFPDIVLNESLSKDGTNWTFDLRAGVKFHDGSPLNA
jgi:ABC-type transport system substrate-binding protein